MKDNKQDQLVKEVLKQLVENDFVIFLETYIWSSEQVEFLGYVISPDRIEIGENKSNAIKES
jgi:hypothetical protein